MKFVQARTIATDFESAVQSGFQADPVIGFAFIVLVCAALAAIAVKYLF